MNKKRIVIVILIAIVIAMSIYISVSYGYYVISSNKTVEMNTTTSTPSCLGLTITNSSAFTLEADYTVPITDEQFLNSSETTQKKFKYSFTVKNDCEEQKKLSIGLVSLDGSTVLMPKLKYILVENGSSEGLTKENVKSVETEKVSSLSEDIKKYLEEKYSVSSPATYKIGDVTIDTKTDKNYDLYLWIGSDAENTTMDQSLKTTVILYDPTE